MMKHVLTAVALVIATGSAQAQDYRSNPYSGTMRSHPNPLGGQTYQWDGGGTVTSRPNPLGGSTFNTPDGRQVVCRPNPQGGQTCH
jgi:hypothetical protein